MSTSFKKIVQKVINAKAKAGLKSNAIAQDLDVCCPRNHCYFYTTLAKIYIQRFNIKKYNLKESRSKELKPAKKKIAPPRSNFTKLEKTSHQNKKKKYLKKKPD